MAEYDGSGFPLSYCLLSTATSTEIGKRTKALSEWAQHLRDTYGVVPAFAHVDKDMAEIGMLQLSWRPKIQLCWWHMRRAVGEQLDKKKLTTTPYNPGPAKSEFPFISLDFIPPGTADPHEHEGGLLASSASQAGMIEVPHYKDLNAINIRIPAFAPVQPLPLTASGPRTPQIRINKCLNISDPENVHGCPTVPQQSDKAEKLTIKLPPQPENMNSHGGKPDSLESVQEQHEMPETRTFCPSELKEDILSMIERHYCAHPLIPGYSSPTPEGIQAWAVKQMYNYCITNNL